MTHPYNLTEEARRELIAKANEQRRTLATMRQSRLSDEAANLLVRQYLKQDERRFTGESITGFGSL